MTYELKRFKLITVKIKQNSVFLKESREGSKDRVTNDINMINFNCSMLSGFFSLRGVIMSERIIMDEAAIQRTVTYST